MLEKAPNARITTLLTKLGEALAAGDSQKASELFLEDSYWRDLVSFTWNITTMEGRDAIRQMLDAQLSAIHPSNWQLAKGEEASEASGITEAFISFETDAGRGYGHIRVKNGGIWTL